MADTPTTAEPGKPSRRWYQFRLRTLLVGVVLVAILMIHPLTVRARAVRCPCFAALNVAPRKREEVVGRLNEGAARFAGRLVIE